MRNGNSTDGYIELALPISFYLTYEEWKPVYEWRGDLLSTTFLPYLWGMETWFFDHTLSPRGIGFYLTYEEWKLIIMISIQSIVESFYLTYEEWKQVKPCLELFGVSSFLPYLWGMETTKDRTDKEFNNCVFTLPMRNGNFPVPVVVGWYVTCFYLTYEEWKHVSEEELQITERVFTLPMRNGNADFLLAIGITCLSFYLTYEEWKLLHHSKTVQHQIVFTLPMRNGNRDCIMLSTWIWIGFYLPMRNGNPLW